VPRTVVYKPNSVIYFQGDVADRVFVLKSGRVTLVSNDIETGEEIHDSVTTGEFFGVRSAIGRYPREENAIVVSTAQIIAFTTAEFEQFASTNTRITLKMLKVFSNQLRRIHGKVSNLLAQKQEQDSEEGLFRVAEYFSRVNRAKQAAYAFRRYLEIYPGGRFASEAQAGLDRHEKATSTARRRGAPDTSNGGDVTGSAAAGQEAAGEARRASAHGGGSGTATVDPATQTGATASDADRLLVEGRELTEKGSYPEALKRLRSVASAAPEQYARQATVEIGRVLEAMGEPDQAIQELTALVQKSPRMPELATALVILARGYLGKGESQRALALLRKAKSIAADSVQVRQEADELLRELGEG